MTSDGRTVGSEDAHETVIHNHRASFWSCNLKGSYLHHLWGVTGDKEQHYMLNRTQDPELTGEMVAVPGKLDILQLGSQF